MNHDGYSGAHLMLAFLAGTVGGACAALLMAPQSGTETRDVLRTWTRDAQDRAGGWARGAQGTAARVPTALRLAYSQASEAARQAFTEALHDQSEGGSDTSAEA